jgi:AraC-like DNA-binding protein
VDRRHPADRSAPVAARPGAVERDRQLLHLRRPLFHGLGVSVVDFRCRAHVESQGREEPNATHSIVFVRRGVFTRTDRDRTLVADANQILFFNQGQPYRYGHPLPGGDDCTILALDEAAGRMVTERLSRYRANDAPGPFPAGHAPSTRRAARLHHELLALGSGPGAAPELAIQEVVADLVDESVQALQRMMERGGRARPRRRVRAQERIEAAKLMLSSRLDAPPSLTELAAALDCSPFHLSRIFRAETGFGLRHYIRRLRSQLAADRLRRGARDLTSLALDLGFYDHSQFTNAFRRELGVPPSRLRRVGDAARARRQAAR